MSRTVRKSAAPRKDRDPLRSGWFAFQEWIAANSRPILTIGSLALGLTVVFGAIYYFTEYRRERALAAFADAFAKYTATVGEASPGTTASKVTFPDKETKFRDAAQAFERLSQDYGVYSHLGKYYAALSYLELGDDKGLALLTELADGGSEVANEARLALAEQHLKREQYAEAEAVYAKLVDDPKSLPAAFLKTRLALVKERLGKPSEAATLYKQVVDIDRTSPAGIEAEKGLQRVDPKLAASLPPKTPTPQPGAGAFPGGMQPGVGGPGGMPPGLGF